MGGITPTAAVLLRHEIRRTAITEGLRLEMGGDIRVTLISPGVTESELADSVSDEQFRQFMKEYRQIAIPASAIARSIMYATKQPVEVDANEIIVRPPASPN